MPASTVHAVLVPLPAQPALARRPGHRRADPPLRARRTRVAAARGREEARQRPRRRRLALRRPPTRADRNRGRHPRQARAAQRHDPLMGTAFVHTVIDDHSRVAYAEIHDDETAATAIARAAPRGGLVRRPRRHRRTGPVRQRQRLPSPTSGATPAPTWASPPRRTRPYRPQTNGKIERFHRTLAAGWAFSRLYNSARSARRAALPAWLHEYNHHRPHTAIGKATPITRLTNLPGQYT